MPNLTIRPAMPEDVATCIKIRGLTRENSFSEEELRVLGITRESWSAGIRTGASPGLVACADDEVIGYCFGDRSTGEISVLAILPEHERRGIGKLLLELLVKDFVRFGFRRLFLSCASDPKVRSYGFYRHLGWTPTGQRDEFGDDILELLPSA
jgi:ribosomal protein S18 acetylase RimI-like enzyme